MTIDKIFPNPTVKQVLFQVRFPNLFYLENKIGDLQMRVMDRFPESSLLHRRQIVFADLGPDSEISDIPRDSAEALGAKVWQFKSPQKFVLNITSNSLDITSEYHKSYNLEGGDKFRDIIQFVVGCFLAVAPIPVFERIGLRYIDECPILEKNNATLCAYYNTTFPVGRFDIADAIEMEFKTVVHRNGSSMRYSESLVKIENTDQYKLIMDFDGARGRIEANKYLEVLDSLHILISDEYEKSIKQPLIDYMSQPKVAEK
jgi:uncharacterized protein (TIGR04255 family)